MIKFKKSLAYLLVAVLLLTGFQPIASASQDDYRSMIETERLDDQWSSVLVYLKEQADLESTKSAYIGEGQAREIAERKAIIGQLQETATLSQESLLEYLAGEKEKGNVKDYTSFYIINAISVKAKAEVIDYLAQADEVKQIYENQVIRPIKPIKDKERRRVRRAVESNKSEIEWHIKQIGADTVWQKLGIDGSGVTIGIIDAGTNYQLPQLRHNFKGYDPSTDTIKQKGCYADFVADSTSNQPQATAAFDHGTHVAGIMVGQPQVVEGRQVNVIGIAPGAKFIAARALGPESGSSEDFLRAAQWMLAPGGKAEDAPQIINNSWGGSNDANPWFYEIVDRWRMANILPVFSAGNMKGGAYNVDGSIANPANMFNTFAVGAVDRKGRLAGFSQVGPSAFDYTNQHIKPDISGPGVQVRSIIANGRYESWNGTSMAAPTVSAVAALVKQANAGLTVPQLEDILKKSAVPATDERFTGSPNMGYGYGIVNAYDAVSKALGEKRGVIKGRVSVSGQDTSRPEVSLSMPSLAFVGQSLTVTGVFKDDVAITEAVLNYAFNGGELQELPMKRVAGDSQDGTYIAKIPADQVIAGQLVVHAMVSDYGQPASPVKSEELEVLVNEGLQTYDNDFEDQVDGWQMQGDWQWGQPTASEEPVAYSGKKVLGTKIGYNTPSRQLDSYLKMPPLDLKNAVNPKLEYMEYVGVNGVTTCQLQLAESEDGPWQVIDKKVIAPGTQAQWQKTSHNLKAYCGLNRPIHLRFYFRFPDHGEGVGWYLDNIRLADNDQQPPIPVEGLSARVETEGIRLAWADNSTDDLEGFTIVKSVNGADYQEIGRLVKGNLNNTFFDSQVNQGEELIYRVLADDYHGNHSLAKEQLELTYNRPQNVIYENFEEGDGQLLTGVIDRSVSDLTQPVTTDSATEINDWQWGHVLPVADDSSIFALREAQLGLNQKKGNKVWATNLGKNPKEGLYDGSVRKNQHAYIQTKPLVLPDEENIVLEFESYNAIHYLPDFQENLELVQISTDDGLTFSDLIGANRVMATDKKWRWQWMEQSLADYRGQTVILRFAFKTTVNQVLEKYDLGWYIDHLRVGPQTVVINASPKSTPHSMADVSDYLVDNSDRTTDLEREDELVLNEERSNLSGTIPLTANVEILETGRVAQTKSEDGTYRIYHAPSLENDCWTLRASAYGYFPESRQVTLAEGQEIEQAFVLQEKGKATLRGKITDNNGQPLSDVGVRLVEDSNYGVVRTNQDGEYQFAGVYEGDYTVRAFKKGYQTVDDKVVLTANGSVQCNLVLAADSGVEKTVIYDQGTAKEKGSVVLNQKNRGVAVRFRPEYQGGQLIAADIYFEENTNVTDKSMAFGVLQHNETGRLIEIGQFRIQQVVGGGWHKVSFLPDKIVTNRSFYIVAKQTHKGPNSFGVALDKTTDPTTIGAKNSFYYNGSFKPLSELNLVGVAMIRAHMLYPPEAAVNKVDSVLDWDWLEGDQVDDLTPEEEFVFVDEIYQETGARGYIEKYNGTKTEVVVPSTIKGQPVRAIADNAFKGSNQRRLTSVKLPDSIEYIGNRAFQGNHLTKIDLPVNLKELGDYAFAYATSYSASIDRVHIPDKVTVIGDSAFAGSGILKFTGLRGVTKLTKRCFAGLKAIEVDIPNVTAIDKTAFQAGSLADYAKLFTGNKNSHDLKDVAGSHLIDPAKVIVKMVEATTENPIALNRDWLGPEVNGVRVVNYQRSHLPSDYYKIGQSVKVVAPSITSYIPLEREATIRLEEPIAEWMVTYRPAIGAVRLPVFIQDKQLVGRTQTNCQVTVNGQLVKVDSHGFYEAELSDLKLDQPIELIMTDDIGQTTTRHIYPLNRQDYQDVSFIVDKEGCLLRYIGLEKQVTIPRIVKGREIKKVADLAFYKKDLEKVTFFEGISEIGEAAFYGNQLTELGLFNTIRTIKDYAFYGNRLDQLILPDLTHKIGDWAFANNRLKQLTLGKYTGHFGRRSFSGNQLVELQLPVTIEELGQAAFAENQLAQVNFTGVLTGEQSHAIRCLPEQLFMGNQLTEIILPKTIEKVAESAFYDNHCLVNLVTPIAMTEAVDSQRGGHLINGVTIKLNYVDRTNQPLANSDQWVGIGRQQRTLLAPHSYFRQGVVSIVPKTIKGYKQPEAIKVKAVAGKLNEQTIVYDKVTNNNSGGDNQPGNNDGGGSSHDGGFVNQTEKVKKNHEPIQKNKKDESLMEKGAPFNDIRGHWAQGVIDWTYQQGLFRGVDDQHFAPERDISRAQFITVLGRWAGVSEESQGGHRFNDVTKGYYAPYVNWAASQSIVNGYADGWFRPEKSVTRQQAAVILYRFLENQGIDLKEEQVIKPTISDYQTISQWAKPAVNSLLAEGIIKGRSDKCFCPQMNLSRAEMAQLLKRVDDIIKQKTKNK